MFFSSCLERRKLVCLPLIAVSAPSVPSTLVFMHARLNYLDACEQMTQKTNKGFQSDAQISPSNRLFTSHLSPSRSKSPKTQLVGCHQTSKKNSDYFVSTRQDFTLTALTTTRLITVPLQEFSNLIIVEFALTGKTPDGNQFCYKREARFYFC